MASASSFPLAEEQQAETKTMAMAEDLALMVRYNSGMGMTLGASAHQIYQRSRSWKPFEAKVGVSGWLTSLLHISIPFSFSFYLSVSRSTSPLTR
jgi:hypothetical protein